MNRSNVVRELEKQMLASFMQDRRASDVFPTLRAKGFSDKMIHKLFNAHIFLRYIVRVSAPGAHPSVYVISKVGIQIYRTLYAKEA